MSFGAIGVGITAIGVGAGIAGQAGLFGGGGGGGGGGGMSGISAELMAKYVAEVDAIANGMTRRVKRIAEALKTEVSGYGNDYLANASAEELKAIERINSLNQQLSNIGEEQSQNLTAELNSALSELTAATETLNLQSRNDTLAELNSYKQELKNAETSALDQARVEFERAGIDTANLARDFQEQTGALGDRFLAAAGDFRRDSDALASEGRQDIRDYQSDSAALGQQARSDAATFRSDSLAAGDRFRQDLYDFQTGTKSLGDQFLERAQQAQQQYISTMGQAASTDPDRVAQFTRMADQLSQAAVQTRANMLATADPRGVELSQMADENAAAMMSGRISADVQANLSRSGAMQALQGGFGASSEMGRGLVARDLGLTSLDLQRQGAQLNDAQRRLNFDTRVAGLQADAGGLFRDNQQLLSEQGRTILGAQMQTAESLRNQQQAGLDTVLRGAESDRNQRVGVFESVLRASDADLARRQGSLDTSLSARQNNAERRQSIFDTGLRVAESDRNLRSAALEGGFTAQRDAVAARRDLALGLTRDIYGTQVNAAGTVLNENLANLNDINNSRQSLFGTTFNTRTGLADQLFRTNMGLATDMYGTATGAVSDFYRTNVGVAGDIFAGRSAASTNAASFRATAEANRLNAVTSVRTNAAGTMANAYQQDMLNRQQQTASNNALWGSFANTAASLGGGFLGKSDFSKGGFGMSRSQMASATIPGTTGSYQSWAGGYVPKATGVK